MKYNLKKIMKRAWEIKRENSKNIFSLCLKMAWEEAKKPSHPLKKQLIFSAEEQLQKINRRRAKKNLEEKTMGQVFPWFDFVVKCEDEKFFKRIEKRFKDYDKEHTLSFTSMMDSIYDAPILYYACEWLGWR